MQIIFGLRPSIYNGREVMVRSAYKTIFPCLIEIFIEINIKYTFTFCSLDNDKSDRLSVDACFGNTPPAYGSLIVADINAMNAKAFGNMRISVKRFPPAAYRCRDNHKGVEEKDVKEDNGENGGPENTFCTTSEEQETKARTMLTRVPWTFPPGSVGFACISFMYSIHGLRAFLSGGPSSISFLRDVL